MEKHTPGPWETTPFSSIVGCVITAQPDKTQNTFNIGSIHGGRHINEVKANAKLIAASPLMYDYIKKQADNGDSDAKLILATLE